MRIATALAITLLFNVPAWAINKCTSQDGRTTFQDAPCQQGKGEKIEVRPASGYTAAPSAQGSAVTPTAKRQTEAERIEANIAVSQRDRRIRTIDETLLPNARNNIEAKQSSCQREMSVVRDRKRAANNNLAGATWEQSLSSEMGAIATRCDTETRTLIGNLERLQIELSSLQASKATAK